MPSGAVSIPLPEPFDFAWAVRFLSARIVPSMERLSEEEYQRCTRLPSGAPLTLSVRLVDGGRALSVRGAPSLPAKELSALVTRMFDLDADLGAFLALARKDAVLAPLVARRPALRLPQLLDPFEGLVRAILGQQVSVAAATTLAGRLVQRAGEDAPPLDGETLRAFPSPAALAALDEEALRALGLTRARAASVLAAARAAVEGALPWEGLRRMSAAQSQEVLTRVRGVGPWTASYLRMRALGDRDAFPHSDLGVIKALRARCGLERPADILALAERWRPWRAYATLHLWHGLADGETAPVGGPGSGNEAPTGKGRSTRR
jgi:3-methyladenine DNA glycosylase/8-oxoguanine DNA glycosylase